MNKDETLALWAQGKDAWNAWAKKILERCPATEVGACRLDDLATSGWLIDASADFEKHVFEDEADFVGFIFPATAKFEESVFKSIAYFIDAKFCGEVRFDNATFEDNTQFDNVRFREEAYFYRTTFCGDAWFSGSRFLGNAHYENANFEKKARFDKAGFHSDALFEDGIFGGKTKFENSIFWGTQTNFIRVKFVYDSNFRSRFRCVALFHSAVFAGDADFGGADFPSGLSFANAHFHGEATFAGNSFVKRSVGNVLFTGTVFQGYTVFHTLTFSGRAEFDRCCFKSYAAFLDATFKQRANFAAVQCESFFSFEGCEFIEVPDFNQAHFSEAPRLDDVSIPEVGGIARFLLPVLPRIEADAGTSARYRALKRLAIQGHDHIRELDYFASELNASRGYPDSFLPCPVNLLRKDEKGRRLPWWPGGLGGTTRYWFGLVYEILSNFGRSIVLLLIWWLAATAGFTWLYVNRAISADRCAVGSGADTPWSAALGLSIRKALPFAGIASSEKLNQIYACLYGIHAGSAAGPGALPERFIPVIPDAVDYLGMVQLVRSLLLLFLFLLAVRNHFRIR